MADAPKPVLAVEVSDRLDVGKPTGCKTKNSHSLEASRKPKGRSKWFLSLRAVDTVIDLKREGGFKWKY